MTIRGISQASTKFNEIHLVQSTIWTNDFIDVLNTILKDDQFQINNEFINENTRILIVDKFIQDKCEKGLQSQGKLDIFGRFGTEPNVAEIDEFVQILKKKHSHISCVIAVGGGSTLDFGKAVSNMLTNPGISSDYQGWELLERRGVPKIGIPTLFGTGSETSRTCVLLNQEKKIKLGMNSKYSMFDLLVIDPGLSRSADLKNIFFTGMDGYFHALEIIRGSNRFPLTDSIAKSAYEISRESLNQLFEVGLSEDVFEKLAVCSFLGGIALANGTVGLIHPISAALSVVLDISHGEANCLASLALGEYYPEDSSFFENIMNGFVDATNYKPPLKIRDIRKNLNELIESTIVHEKPLSNHLGEDWRVVLNNTELERIFLKVSNLNLSSRR